MKSKKTIRKKSVSAAKSTKKAIDYTLHYKRINTGFLNQKDRDSDAHVYTARVSAMNSIQAKKLLIGEQGRSGLGRTIRILQVKR